jgi:competence protein ComEC
MRIQHPILQNSMASVSLAGFVEIREEREKSDRIVVRVQRFDGPSAAGVPDRVRVAVRKGSAPAVGSFVEFKARLSPPRSHCAPAVTILHATCISSASALPATCSVL